MSAASFALGFAFALAVVFLFEIGAHLIERNRTRRRFEKLTAEPLHEFESNICPWPIDAKFPHRLSGVPEIGAAARETSNRAMANSGFAVGHLNSSSRLLSGGSEGSI